MLFFDASVLIWRTEGEAPFRKAARDAVAGLVKKFPDPVFAASRLARLECRVKPLREGNRRLLALYERAFTRDLKVFDVSAAVLERATELRAALGLKTADAIHAATALLAGARVFITADAGFERVPGLNVCLVKLSGRKVR